MVRCTHNRTYHLLPRPPQTPGCGSGAWISSPAFAGGTNSPCAAPPSTPLAGDDSAVMCGGFQGGPQLDPHDAERRKSLGQLCC